MNNDVLRSILWQKFKELELRLSNLKAVVQNEMEFTEEDLHKFLTESDNFVQSYNLVIVGTKRFISENIHV